MKKRFTVADFFCGAGGFSEGFRQGGFKVVFAMDNWEPARKTHNLNHPGCQQPVDGNILSVDVNKINNLIPDVDIIIGSPPCVNFSCSNRAGNADKKDGVELIKKFLQIVAVKKHKPNSKLKYWLMENVPNSRMYIKDEYLFKDLGINNNHLKSLNINKSEKDVALRIDASERKIYNSVYYGVPQKRERFITGEFPEPEKITKSQDDWISLGQILNAFRIKNGVIKDPIYVFNIPEKNLTDHFYNTEIPRFEWEEAKTKKQQARQYGKMSFPEDESRPARTIMATRAILAREAIIFSNGKLMVYRAPTIREIASIMSFPITYLFDGKDESIKYKLVGNAVCPKLAYCLAKSISKDLKIKENKNYNLKIEKPRTFIDLRSNPPPQKKPRPKHHLSNFCEIVPDLKIKNFRVELDNNFPKKNHNGIIWNGSIHHATGKDSMKKAIPDIKILKSILIKNIGCVKYENFHNDLLKQFKNKIPNTEEFQNLYCNYRPGPYKLTPRKSLLLIKKIVNKHFKNRYEVLVSNKRKDGKDYISFNRGKLPNNVIPIRIIAASYGVSIVSMLTKQKPL